MTSGFAHSSPLAFIVSASFAGIGRQRQYLRCSKCHWMRCSNVAFAGIIILWKQPRVAGVEVPVSPFNPDYDFATLLRDHSERVVMPMVLLCVRESPPGLDGRKNLASSSFPSRCACRGQEQSGTLGYRRSRDSTDDSRRVWLQERRRRLPWESPPARNLECRSS